MEAIDIGADDLEWSPVKRQHFFKVLIGDFTRRLRIPSKFVKHIDIGKEAGNKTAMLEGPTGRTWYVSIEKTTDGMFFTDGWSKFVQDHSLKEYEFMVFRYNGSMHFSLLLFDKTACEREFFDLCNGKDNGGLKKEKLNAVYVDGGKSNGKSSIHQEENGNELI
ncbi:B3 domain-containing protein [Carex littledalei]|uniref:B3 domain-containing protein n=1 Tax=Carex littledalei TaxID=544730 RepID=A0A833VDQ0_9POAL|nr:B3 domain-containing protein [Carex littledalei]